MWSGIQFGPILDVGAFPHGLYHIFDLTMKISILRQLDWWWFVPGWVVGIELKVLFELKKIR